MWYLLVAIHEIGHTVADAIVGCRWKHVVIGPLKISRESGSIKMSYSGNVFGGEAAAFPRPNDHQVRRAIGIIGGPVATVLCFIGGWLGIQSYAPQQVPIGWVYWEVLAGYMLVSSLIPIQGRRNDIAILLDLCRQREMWAKYYEQCRAASTKSPAGVARYEALKALSTGDYARARPRDWPRELVEKAREPRDGRLQEMVAAHWAFYHYCDAGGYDLAGECISRAIELRDLAPQEFVAKVLLDLAYYQAFIQNAPTKARGLLAEVSAMDIESDTEISMIESMRTRAEAAVALCEGRTSDAIELVALCTRHLDLLDQEGKNSIGDRALLERLTNPE